MDRFVMIRDFRIDAGIPNRPGLGIINTDDMTPLGWVFRTVNAYARWGQLKAIFILAHGSKAGVDAQPRTDGVRSFHGPTATCKDAGGMGISLGAEGIRHTNVHLWSAIRGAAENIVVYSCAAADTQPGNQGTVADGRYLMGALAIHTRAAVYAATQIQRFTTYKHLADGRFMHKGWSGQLLRFPSDGSRGIPVSKSLKFDFSQVMAGTNR
jgi:hypothetical protein